MKQRPIPTSPGHHPKRQENQDHIEELYRDDSLKVFAKPIVSVRFLSYFLGSVIFGFTAGVVGYLFASSFLISQLGGDTGSVTDTTSSRSWDILTDLTSTGGNTESEQTQKLVSLISSSVVSVFPKKQEAAVGFDRSYAPDQSVASGVIVTSDGYILTQAAPLDREAQYVVMTGDGKIYPVVKLIIDHPVQTAWLKVDAAQLRPVELAEAADIFSGQEAFIVKSQSPSKQPFVLKDAVSQFHVPSSEARLSSEQSNVFLSLTQVSPEFLPGAAVFDNHARLLGITYRFPDETYHVYPSYVVKAALQGVLKTHAFSAPILGLSYRNVYDLRLFLTDQKAPAFGVLVDSVADASAAFAADIQSGDIITALDGEAIDEAHDIFLALVAHKPGDTVQLTFYREGQEKRALVTLDGPTQAAEKAPAD